MPKDFLSPGEERNIMPYTLHFVGAIDYLCNLRWGSTNPIEWVRGRDAVYAVGAFPLPLVAEGTAGIGVELVFGNFDFFRTYMIIYFA